ncbi:hypothetical protein NicSoilB4_22790 [Arthrobacter sp. NicSoilB4]|uniref:class F sortase n=1 Tax=Arthrobacter sp. NicSoilB4 TaxID=2830997 RepID=UPI001CC4C440|nr:class F sortase [Arthrobacter sp. NicSoilB4]BCW67516.1 hypothetical protein NicSoilB4_22790 [Arthrobacter sp. NicSoilB4]
MSWHRRNQLPRVPGIRGLALGPRDMLLLAACVVGILAAWLFYAASGPGSVQPAYGQAAAAAKPVTGNSSPPPTSVPSDVPIGSSSGLLPIGAAAASPAALEPPAQSAEIQPAASVPQRITYPAAGMDVTIHPLDPPTGDAETTGIVPPETMDGYWLTPFGTPGDGSANTTYIVGHSWEGLDAPFNHLSSAAAPGDVLSVATETGILRYAVESVTTYTKSTLKDSPVWDAVPNRLVLISCYTEDPWGKNVVVIATPDRGP